MTATLPEEFEYKEILFGLAPTVYKISLDKCVELGLVSPYQIICIPIELTTVEEQEYKKAKYQLLNNEGEKMYFQCRDSHG